MASLLALHDDFLDSLVTAYCQQFGIGSRVASFLVLENDGEYKRLNLEEERGKTLSGDLGAFVESAWDQRARESTPREELERFLRRVDRRFPLMGQAGHVRKLLELLRDEDLALPDLEPVTMSEVGTKLDLARAYMDMGDPDGARNILEEVLNECSAAQKQEAQRLMESLP